MRLFGIPIVVDFSVPPDEEEIESLIEDFRQARADGDNTAKHKAGTRLLESGRVWNGETWVPKESEE